MTSAFEKFVGAVKGLPGEFLDRLNRNFERAALVEEVYAISETGFVFKPTDNIRSLNIDSTSGNLTVYLPVSPTGERRRTITKTVAANVITINGNGSLINGAATQALTNQYDSITVEPTGTGWLIVSIYP